MVETYPLNTSVILTNLVNNNRVVDVVHMEVAKSYIFNVARSTPRDRGATIRATEYLLGEVSKTVELSTSH